MNGKYLLVILLAIFFVKAGIAQSFKERRPKSKVNKPLAAYLNNLSKVDQLVAQPQPKDGKLSKLNNESWEKYVDSTYRINALILIKIFKRYGYPGYDQVGKKGEYNFWLMVQHCDQFPKFQQEVLNAMKIEIVKKNADIRNYAFLVDRIKVNRGEKQVFGTQVTYNTEACQAVLLPVIDSLRIDIRRKSVTLEPIKLYLNNLSEIHFEMNKDIYLKKGIKKAKLY